jgi:hypothetical protein
LTDVLELARGPFAASRCIEIAHEFSLSGFSWRRGRSATRRVASDREDLILGARPRAGPSVSPYPKSESSRRGAESSSSHPSTFAPSSSGSTQCSIRNRHRRVRHHARARVRSCGYAGGGHPEAGARSDRGERLDPCVAASRTPLPDGIRCFTYP